MRFRARISTFLTALVAVLVFSQSAISAEQKSSKTFAFEEYFLGKTIAYGRFQAINGTDRRFKVDLQGSWNGKTLKLVEHFTYDDGERDTKTWYFTKTDEGRYIGKRDDVRGSANVRIRGNTARYGYALYLDPENRKNLVRFRDKMVLREDGIVVNTATVFKSIFPVGKVRVVFARPKDAHKIVRP